MEIALLVRIIGAGHIVVTENVELKKKKRVTDN